MKKPANPMLRPRTLCSLLAAGFLANASPFLVTGRAQEAVISQVQSVSPVTRRTSKLSNPASSLPTLFRDEGGIMFRGVRIRPNFSASYARQEGVLTAPGESRDSNRTTLSPSILFDFGERWSLGYRSTWVTYSNDNFQDRRHDSLDLSGEGGIYDWQVGVNYSYSTSSTTLIETGRETPRTSHSFGVNSAYSLNSNNQLSFQVGYDFNATNEANPAINFSDYKRYSLTGFLQHKFSPIVIGGLGIGLSKADVTDGRDSDSRSVRASLTVPVSQKLNASISTGYQERDYGLGLTAGGTIYNGTISYSPRETTRISLSASRGFSPSVISNRENERRSTSISLSQRLFGTYYLNASLSDYDQKYLDTTNLLLSTRQDNVESWSVSVSTQLRNFGSLSVFHSESDNNSSADEFDFGSRSTGVRFSLVY